MYQMAAKKNFTEASKWLQALFSYEDSNKENGYSEQLHLQVILYMMQYQFEEAQQLVEFMDDAYWKSIVSEKNEVYCQIKNQQYYDEAQASYQQGHIAESLVAARKAVDYYSTLESWRLYAELILENAKEENYYLRSDLERLIFSEQTPEQVQVLEQETDRISILKTSYLSYMENQRNQIITKIKENDIEFFKNNLDFAVNFIDDYGMNALMYAALYHRKEILEQLVHTNIDKNQKNMLDFDVIDLIMIGSDTSNASFPALKDMLALVDPYYQERYAEYEQTVNSKQAEIRGDETLAKVSGALGRVAEGQKNYQAAATAADRTAKLAEHSMAAQNAIEEAEKQYNSDIEEHFMCGWLKAQTAFVYLVTAVQNVPTITSEDSLEEYLCFPEYRKLSEKEKTSFTENYLKENLSQKGEFETTAQYEQRRQNILYDAENQFSEYILQLLKKTHQEKISVSQKQEKESSFARWIAQEVWNIIPKTASLEEYNADKQSFAFKWKGWSNEYCGTISISLDIAQRFKQTFSEGMPFIIKSVSFTEGIAQCAVVFEETEYPFMIRQHNFCRDDLLAFYGIMTLAKYNSSYDYEKKYKENKKLLHFLKSMGNAIDRIHAEINLEEYQQIFSVNIENKPFSVYYKILNHRSWVSSEPVYVLFLAMNPEEMRLKLKLNNTYINDIACSFRLPLSCSQYHIYEYDDDDSRVEIKAGIKKHALMLRFFDYDLEKNNIKNVEKLEFTMECYKEESEDLLYKKENIIISFPS